MAAEAAIKRQPMKRPVRDLYRRIGGVSLPCGPQNLVHFLRSRETSGPLRTRDLMLAHFFQDLDILRSHRGHLAAVIQIHYDAKCIHYVTLSRDGQIKLWQVWDGRLVGVYRSDVKHICDIALSRDDRFLIGVSDYGIALWDFKTKELLAIITHTASVSRIFFMTKPECEVKHFVVVTKEALVTFFKYRDRGARRGVKLYNPRTKSVRFPEARKDELIGRTAVAELSPCGTYLFVGLRHVRVFAVDPATGPEIIINVDMGKDTFVTLMSWSNAGDRFLTVTSTETKTNNQVANYLVTTINETTELWNYSIDRNFDRKALDFFSFKRENNRSEVHAGQTWAALALCWDAFDQYFVTANKLGVIQVWDPDTCRVITQTFVEDSIKYLRAHPIETGIIVSAGVDSIIIFWDMLRLDYNDDTPTAIVSFTNQTRRVPKTLTNMVWSNDGTVFLVADEDCYVTTYGRLPKVDGVPVNAEEGLTMPKQLFFHTEFQPLVRDSDGRLLDKEAGLPPHLVPPPFLVDMDGNPYPPALQRLVPGREHCSDAELTPGVDVLYGIYKNTNNWSPEVREDLEWMLAKYWREENESILV